MNPKYEIHEWIDRYLQNEMSELERQEFEDELRRDDDLVKTVEAQKVANKIVIGEELLQLRKQMEQDLRGNGYGSGGNLNKAWKYYVSGALIATVAIVYFLWQRNSANNDNSNVSNSQQRLSVEKQLISEDTIIVKTLEENASFGKKEDETLSGVETVPGTLRKKQNSKNILCSDSIITFSCQARGTCIQREEGAIEIDVKTIKSGNAPYQFSIFPESGFQENSVLSDLKPGKYQLFVKDGGQCLRKLNVEIEVPLIPCSNNNLSK